jgi:hypothetical protein
LKWLSESEKLFADRYMKPKINLQEYIIQHQASKRNYPQGKKIKEIKSLDEMNSRRFLEKNKELSLELGNKFISKKLS